MRVVPLAREQSFLGGSLAAVGIAGIPVAGLGGVSLLASPTLFALGLAVPLLWRRRLAVDREPEGEPPYVPAIADVEGLWRTALRVCPTLMVVAILLLGVAVIDRVLAAATGGVVSGLGIVELRAIAGLSRWERRHDLVLYAEADWFLLSRRSTVYQPKPR
jgi:hypothetical protein